MNDTDLDLAHLRDERDRLIVIARSLADELAAKKDHPMTHEEFYTAVFAYCKMTGASTTSGIRTDTHNTHVGGVLHSPHRYGFGMDVVYDVQADDVMKAFRVETAKRLGLLLYWEVDHDHLQPLEWMKG